MEINFLLFDDHPSTIYYLKKLISKNFPESSIFDFDNHSDCLNFLNINSAEIIIISDIGIKGEINFNLLEYAAKNSLKCILYTGYNQIQFLEFAINLNVNGFVNKLASDEEFINAIVAIKNNETFYCNNFKEMLEKKGDKLKKFKIPKLNDREIKVLKLLIEGDTNHQIADKIHASYHTVRAIRKNMLLNNNCTLPELINQFCIWKMNS